MWRKSVTYGMSCHAIGHLVIYRKLRIWERVFHSQAFFTLLSFLLVLRSRQFNLKVSRTSCWSSKHSPGPTIHLNHNNPQNRYGGRFYLRFTAGRLMKNLPLMGFELFFNMWACQIPHALSVRPQNLTGCDKALVFVII